jgi:hypothetical protein
VARNGTIIEQVEVLTTHNLGVLFSVLDLTSSLRPQLQELARRCFAWMCRQQQMPIRDWRAQLHMIKNTAYAWRQMLFYLSVLEHSDVTSFLEWSDTHMAGQEDTFRERFLPAMHGLAAVVAGAHCDTDGLHPPSGGRHFLGWSVGQHWLLARRP